jgi:hypothetical protein
MSAEQRYERYAAWCRILGVKPASIDTWRRETAKICEYSDFPDGTARTRVLVHNR